LPQTNHIFLNQDVFVVETFDTDFIIVNFHSQKLNPIFDDLNEEKRYFLWEEFLTKVISHLKIVVKNIDVDIVYPCSGCSGCCNTGWEFAERIDIRGEVTENQVVYELTKILPNIFISSDFSDIL